MSSVDLGPFYRSSIGYDRVGRLIDNALRASESGAGYPPYNIEVLSENSYAITLAVAGFKREQLDLSVENGVLTIAGKKGEESGERTFLYQGIANRSFERRFNLAEHVEVSDARLSDGVLTVDLKREVPEAMKPRSIPIAGGESNVLEYEETSASNDSSEEQAA
ncbi:MAG: Hsp20 family protein [Halioglobus sp.]|nr:Hsp20 family protein [Halioglobus sp.]